MTFPSATVSRRSRKERADRTDARRRSAPAPPRPKPAQRCKAPPARRCRRPRGTRQSGPERRAYEVGRVAEQRRAPRRVHLDGQGHEVGQDEQPGEAEHRLESQERGRRREAAPGPASRRARTRMDAVRARNQGARPARQGGAPGAEDLHAEGQRRRERDRRRAPVPAWAPSGSRYTHAPTMQAFTSTIAARTEPAPQPAVSPRAVDARGKRREAPRQNLRRRGRTRHPESRHGPRARPWCWKGRTTGECGGDAELRDRLHRQIERPPSAWGSPNARSAPSSPRSSRRPAVRRGRAPS